MTFATMPDPAWLMPGSGYLIDFLIALVFFTALAFAVLGRRLGHARAGAAASAALGFALALGLAAWEVNTGWRISDIGPIAAGFGLIVIALVIYHAMKKIGGQWAGVLIALGSASLIGQVLSLPGLSNLLHGVVLPLVGIGLLAAGMMRLSHHHQTPYPNVSPSNAITPAPIAVPAPNDLEEVRDSQEQVHAIDDVHRLADRIERTLSDTDRYGRALPAHPDLARLIRQQVDAVLPATQQITRQLAELRAHTELVRRGHLAKIRRLAPVVPKLDPTAARLASKRLRDLYDEASLGQRLERLDQAAAATEQRITQTITSVRQSLDAARYHEAASALRRAELLGRQAKKLIAQIDKQQKRVLALAIDAAKQSKEQEASA